MGKSQLLSPTETLPDLVFAPCAAGVLASMIEPSKGCCPCGVRGGLDPTAFPPRQACGAANGINPEVSHSTGRRKMPPRGAALHRPQRLRLCNFSTLTDAPPTRW